MTIMSGDERNKSMRQTPVAALPLISNIDGTQIIYSLSLIERWVRPALACLGSLDLERIYIRARFFRPVGPKAK